VLWLDPVDQVMTLWTSKTGLQGGLGGMRSQCLWMSEGPMFLQLDPLDHHFDPEGQAPTLWTSNSWSTGSEGMHFHKEPIYFGDGLREW
jgi:hypothetical protein